MCLAMRCPVITNVSWLGRMDFRGVFDHRSWTERSMRKHRHQVHNRTPVLLVFSVTLPSTEARGRWRERGGCVEGTDRAQQELCTNTVNAPVV